MLIEQRRTRILELVHRSGYAGIEELARQFKVTPQTIRRDLNALSDDGQLVRRHGGTSLPSSVSNTSYAARHIERAAEKERIARLCAAWLPDRCSIFLSLGTTVAAIAHALTSRRELKIVTHNLEAARTLIEEPSTEVIVLGGALQSRNLGVVGAATLGMLENYRTDYLVLSVGGVDKDGTLLDYHEGEVAIVRAMMKHARRSVLVVDHTKFTRTATVRVAHLRDMSAIITDVALAPRLRKMLDARSTAVIVG